MDYSTETLLRIEAIFNDALAVHGAERAVLIAARCNRDVRLVAEVESLLKASEKEEQSTASHALEPQTESIATLDRRRIGPYEIDRLLGRGGMGAVYLAHRADGQFEQQVAIKLIDLPLATDLFRERFRQERQILAGLQHPLIARLLDGGVSAEGDLYLAMEYVDGKPIQRFCDENNFAVSQRLTLFNSVCNAVQFAHQNLVVHRDLKPDNILVAADGTPRLLDFGTAKLLSPSLAGSGSEFTRQGYQSYTPQYASPEQVLGNPITTASDTYSLGVLLYLLLTGSLPYELKEFTTAEMVRVICQEPPRTPSLAAAPHRRLDADLEAIVLKSLRKEPQERYRTADQLATDVQAYLDGQPVSARRGTLRYRAAKFARRNRLALAASSVLFITLIAGISGILWQAGVANAERRKVEARSADLRQLSSSLMSELDEAIKQLPGSTGAQKLLVTRVLEHLDRMAGDSAGDRLTQLDLVDAYTRLGNIQGNVYDQNLGDPTGALISIGKALMLAEPLAAAYPSDQDVLRKLATAQQSRSEVLFGASNTQDAVTSMRAAVQTYDRLIGSSSASVTPALICEAAAAYGTLGDELGQSGTPSLADTSAALAAYRKTIELDNRALAIDPNFLRAKRGLGFMQNKVGSVELETDPAQALQDFRIGVQRIDALPPVERSNLMTARMRSLTLCKEAMALTELGEYSAAAPLFTEALQTQTRFSAADPKDLRALADVTVLLDDQALNFEDAANPFLGADSQQRQQNLRTAERSLAQVVDAEARLLKEDPGNTNWKARLANHQVRLGTIRTVLHTPGDAEPLSRRGLSELRDLAQEDQASPDNLDLAVSAFLIVEPASLRDSALAVSWAERGVALSHRRKPAWMLSLAQAYRAAGQNEKASGTAKEGLALLPPWQHGGSKPRIRRLLELESRTAVTAPNIPR